MPIRDFVIFAMATAAIIKSADWFTSGASGLAKSLRIPQLVIALTIVSLATSVPEFAVSTISAYISRLPSKESAGGLAVGTVIGSNIGNIGLLLGLVAAMMGSIHFQPRVIKLELRFLIGITILLFPLMLNFRSGQEGILRGGSLGFWDGFLLSVLLIGSFVYIVGRELRIKRKTINSQDLPLAIRKDALKFFIGAVGVIASAKYGIVPSGVSIARFLGVPEIVIGLSIVAVGTSLPELSTVLVAMSRKMGDMAVGTVIGSNIVNILWVLGTSSLINPLAIDSQTLRVSMPVMLSITVVMLIFARSGFRLVRWEGAFLFLIYLAYLVYLFKFAY